MNGDVQIVNCVADFVDGGDLFVDRTVDFVNGAVEFADTNALDAVCLDHAVDVADSIVVRLSSIYRIPPFRQPVAFSTSDISVYLSKQVASIVPFGASGWKANEFL